VPAFTAGDETTLHQLQILAPGDLLSFFTSSLDVFIWGEHSSQTAWKSYALMIIPKRKRSPKPLCQLRTVWGLNLPPHLCSCHDILHISERICSSQVEILYSPAERGRTEVENKGAMM
jgi:hypothetical protein